MDDISTSRSRSSSSATIERTSRPAIVPGRAPLVRTAILFVILLLLIAPGTLPNVAMTVIWEEDGVCVLSVSLPEDATGDGVWVITLLADRYEDGVFAWQLHWSPEQANVVVLPNDFLTSRAFLLEQLGIATEISADQWNLRIPRHGAIPELIVPGDTLRVHALWLQQDPIGSIVVPEVSLAAADPAGAGGAQPPEPLAEQPEAPVAEPETETETADEAPSNEPLPAQSIYGIGEPITHRFIPVDPVSGAPRIGAHATATLLRVFKDKPPDLQIYKILQPDTDGVLDLRIETVDLATGTYELYVWISGEEHAHSMRLELMLSDP